MHWRQIMVYCSRCGTLNAGDAAVCKNCGAPLQPTAQPNYGAYYRQRHYYRDDHYGHRGSGMGALFAGIVIILIGSVLLFSELYGVPINWSAWWAIVIVLVGLWLLFVAFRRNRRYRAPPPSA
jgi:Flp pilus assembly protein TadB